MAPTDIESQCELGQRLLMEMEYLQAERVLAAAEAIAWERRAWDVLSRLYLPLQEARRQRRQRCGEGTIQLDLLATSAREPLNAAEIVQRVPHGQLLVAGWQTLEPAATVRRLAAERGLYVETFLAAVYPPGPKQLVLIAPTERTRLPTTLDHSTPPADCVVLDAAELPHGQKAGTAETYAQTMSLWERLHAPFLARAEAEFEPLEKMRLFRQTIDVDYGCELAHQHLAAAAREQLRTESGRHT
jgi:hypothetical protein